MGLKSSKLKTCISASTPLTLLVNHGSYEGNEGNHCHWQANDEGSDYQDLGRAAWLGAEGLHRGHRVPRGACCPGGEKDWHLHTSRLVPPQAPHQASHEGGGQDYLRKRDEGCGKTRKENRQGFPSGSSEGADLDHTPGGNDSISRGSADVGIPQSELGRCSMTWHSG